MASIDQSLAEQASEEWYNHISVFIDRFFLDVVNTPNSPFSKNLLSALHNWNTWNPSKKMALLFDLCQNMCDLFTVDPPRLFTKKSWKEYEKVFLEIEDPEDIPDQAFFYYNHTYSPPIYAIVFHAPDENFNKEGFLTTVAVLAHEFAHYLLHLYENEYKNTSPKSQIPHLKNLSILLPFLTDEKNKRIWKKQAEKLLNSMNKTKNPYKVTRKNDEYLKIFDEDLVELFAINIRMHLLAALWVLEAKGNENILINMPIRLLKKTIDDMMKMADLYKLPSKIDVLMIEEKKFSAFEDFFENRASILEKIDQIGQEWENTRYILKSNRSLSAKLTEQDLVDLYNPHYILFSISCFIEKLEIYTKQ